MVMMGDGDGESVRRYRMPLSDEGGDDGDDGESVVGE